MLTVWSSGKDQMTQGLGIQVDCLCHKLKRDTCESLLGHRMSVSPLSVIGEVTTGRHTMSQLKAPSGNIQER